MNIALHTSEPLIYNDITVEFIFLKLVQFVNIPINALSGSHPVIEILLILFNEVQP
jgi:hypothetical protein